MSADNGIYIAEFPGPIYRVVEASAIENCCDESLGEDLINKYRQDYFGRCKIFTNEQEAFNEAFRISKLVGWTEYGIQKLVFDRPLVS